MKRLLCGTTALIGVGMMGHSALAEEPIRLTLGGYFKEAYMVIQDDNGMNDEDDNEDPQLGHDTNRDGFFNDAEVHFIGTTVLDNGLEVGVQIEVEGENANHAVDEAYIWFAGGFGEVRVGSDDEALHKACVIPPGGSSNFSAFSPNQWAANTGGLMFTFSSFGDNSICTGVDGNTDAQKIIYTSPVFAGFQLTASYTPNGGVQDQTDGGGPHLGMPEHVLGQSRHNTSVAVNYGYDGRDWGLAASLGGSWEGHKEESGVPGTVAIKEQDFYQAGINLYIGNFAFGVGGEYYNDVIDVRVDGQSIENNIWIAGVGASYGYDAWIFGVQYSHREDDAELPDGSEPGEINLTQDRVVGTATYLFGPGMNFDASLGYTWIDSDPELEDSGLDDDYQAFEVGLGATVTF